MCSLQSSSHIKLCNSDARSLGFSIHIRFVAAFGPVKLSTTVRSRVILEFNS